MGAKEDKVSRRHFANEKTGEKGTPADRLSQESSEALAAGTSYGKYKALQYEAAKGKPTPRPKIEAIDPRLKYSLVCHVCGTGFKSMTKLRKYCSEACANKQYREFARLRKEGARNGTTHTI